MFREAFSLSRYLFTQQFCTRWLVFMDFVAEICCYYFSLDVLVDVVFEW